MTTQSDFALALRTDDGELIVGIRPDGTVETGPTYQPDETAREFWAALSKAAQAANPFGGGQ